MHFRSLLFAVLISLFSVSCGRSGYTIEGNIIDLDEGDISLLDAYGHTLGTAVVEDGKFTFKGKVETPCLAYINNARGVTYPIDIPVLLENEKVISVTGDARISHIEIKGTKANEDMVEFKIRKDALATDDTEGYLNLVKEMFERNSDNVLGSLLISNLYSFVSDRELLNYCKRLSPEFQRDPVVDHYRTLSQSRIDTEPGKIFKDLVMTSADSVLVSLSEVVRANKATVLMFWASWARDASSIIPKVTALCRKYEKEGLTMFNVSLDSDMSRREACEKEFDLFGRCFSNGPEAGDKAASIYGFEGLPRLVLIDYDGRITAKGKTADDIAEGLKSIFE